MVELLAPAGSREALAAAVESGANAVYLAGNMFGARAYADNFDEEGLKEAIHFAHMRKVHVHVTVNTIVDDNELPGLKQYLRFLYEAGADAVLVQDLGAARIVREVVPELPMHASTQMTVHNLDGVRALEALGFSRVVLSRELSLEAIRHICSEAKAEIEVFVHGALCVCYSGQCLMSSMIGGRSGNRGRCAQPCRLPYTLVDENDNDLLAGSVGQYLLSPRDLKTIDLLPELLKAGVSSLKIEGRMKRPEYVATAVGCYRRAVDSWLQGDFQVQPQDSQALAQIFNRDFTTAYLEEKQGRNMMSDKRPNNRGLMLGRVLSYDVSNGMVSMKLNTDLQTGDQVDFWVKVGGRVTTTIQKLYLVKEAKNSKNAKNTKGKKQKAGKAASHKYKLSDGLNMQNLVPVQQGAFGTVGKKQKAGKAASDKYKLSDGLNMQNLVPVQQGAFGTVVAFAVEGRVFPGDRAFKVLDSKLMEEAKAMYASGAPVRRYNIKAQVTAAVGEPLVIQLEDEAGHVAVATTEFIGEPALKRPLSREVVEKQLGRLGSSIFHLQELDVDIAGQVMIPVSEINGARRKAVEELENQRLGDFQQQAGEFSRQTAKNIRQGIANIQQELLRRQAKTEARDIVRPATKGGYITVVADNIPRVRAALANGARRIVFGGESYSHENITLDMCRQAAELAHEYGAAIVLNTPRIIRDSELERFHSLLETVDTYPIDAISVHNIGTLHAVRQLTSLPIEADYSLISYNVEALQHLQELGADRAVLSPELNMSQLEKLGQESPLPLECLVDAYLELMVSEYCCTGSFLGGLDTGHCSAPCVAMKKKFYLKDRKNIRFPLVMDQYCHMHLLNANRLSMLPHAMKFRSMGIAGLRIDGRYLAPDKLGQLVKNYGIYMARRKEISEAERPEVEKLEGRNITRGHYFRGVL